MLGLLEQRMELVSGSVLHIMRVELVQQHFGTLFDEVSSWPVLIGWPSEQSANLCELREQLQLVSERLQQRREATVAVLVLQLWLLL